MEINEGAGGQGTARRGAGSREPGDGEAARGAKEVSVDPAFARWCDKHTLDLVFEWDGTGMVAMNIRRALLSVWRGGRLQGLADAVFDDAANEMSTKRYNAGYEAGRQYGDQEGFKRGFRDAEENSEKVKQLQRELDSSANFGVYIQKKYDSLMRKLGRADAASAPPSVAHEVPVQSEEAARRASSVIAHLETLGFIWPDEVRENFRAFLYEEFAAEYGDGYGAGLKDGSLHRALLANRIRFLEEQIDGLAREVVTPMKPSPVVGSRAYREALAENAAAEARSAPPMLAGSKAYRDALNQVGTTCDSGPIHDAPDRFNEGIEVGRQIGTAEAWNAAARDRYAADGGQHGPAFVRSKD